MTRPRPFTQETGEPRMDLNGVGWYACDPYPTWYRWEDGKLITLFEEDDDWPGWKET